MAKELIETNIQGGKIIDFIDGKLRPDAVAQTGRTLPLALVSQPERGCTIRLRSSSGTARITVKIILPIGVEVSTDSLTLTN
jgi:hypothetical protein